MKNGIISIVDSEEEYAVRLAGFLSKKNGIGYEIQVFTDISSYMSFEEDSHSDILLISDVFGEFIPDLKNSGQIFILSGDTIDISLKDYIHIKKYQSSENILKSIMSELATQPYPKTKVILKDKKQIVGRKMFTFSYQESKMYTFCYLSRKMNFGSKMWVAKCRSRRSST
mgnify:CR=1 FL=1